MHGTIPVARRFAPMLATAAFATLAARGSGSGPATGGSATSLSAKASLGERAFNDPSLTASGRQSCATGHVSAFGHTQDNDLAAQFGGAGGDLQGLRVSQPIRYLSANGAFHVDDEGTPTGGFFWDGRADSLAHQAGGPFLNPVEMAHPDKASVIRRLAEASYSAGFERVYGAGVLRDVERAYGALTDAIAAFEWESPALRPFDSKYDAVLRGQATLTEQEARGLDLFNRVDKGNCAACHPSTVGDDGADPLFTDFTDFTDFTYDALGVPRHPELLAHTNATDVDLGLCTRNGSDPSLHPEWCGSFKVPSLRNVALRKAFFHNGRFKTLKDVLTFHVERDIHPETFYPVRADGSVNKFDDLPVASQGNVNTTEPPYDRTPGDEPALDAAEIDDVIAFLNTLTDGYANGSGR